MAGSLFEGLLQKQAPDLKETIGIGDSESRAAKVEWRAVDLALNPPETLDAVGIVYEHEHKALWLHIFRHGKCGGVDRLRSLEYIQKVHYTRLVNCAATTL